MKKIRFFILLVICNLTIAHAQTVSSAYRKEVIGKINALIEKNYVFEVVATATTRHLDEQLRSGAFENDSTLLLFAQNLTKTVQSVNHDKHMRIWAPVRKQGGTSSSTPFTGSQDGGFREVKILEGNIGYVDLRLFFPKETAASMADEAMHKLEGTKAIIIDLRSNGGGEPAMVQYLCSYFFDKKILLNSLHWRAGNVTEDFWTIDVNGTKQPTIPLYVLTSKRTFSGAEEFAYNMQTQHRATLIGETTGGGANPGGVFRIDDSLSIFIPLGHAINPVTKKNWEGTGVKPDVEVNADSALQEAIGMINAGKEKKGF